MKKNKIEEIDGWGTLTGPSSMDVALNDGSSRQLTFDHLIIAAGAVTRMLPGVTVSQNVVTYEEQILDPNLPGSMIIAGSGAIGVEFAYVMKNFGVDVTIVEFLDRMVPTEDADISKELAKHYKKLGVKVLLGTKVEPSRTPARGCGSPSPRRPVVSSRCSRPTSCCRPSASPPASRATAWSPPASPSPSAAPSRSTSTAAPTSPTSTPSATAPPR
jgi:hypothetical protein